MGEGEILEIQVDMRTADAVSAGAQLVSNLEQQAAALINTAEAANAAEGAIAKLATTATQAASPLEQDAVAANKAATELEKSAKAANEAADKFEKLASSSPRVKELSIDTTSLGTATSAMGASAERAGSQVMGWLGSFVGIAAVVRTIEYLLDKMQKVVEVQNQLADMRFADDKGLQQVMFNLGLQGEAGETRARRLRDDIAVKTGSSLENAAGAIISTNAAGIDVQTPAGASYASEMAKMAETKNLDPESQLALARAAKEAHVTDSEGLKKFEAQGTEIFDASLTKDPAKFWRGLVRALGPEAAKGVDPALTGAIFSSFLDSTSNEFSAAQQTRNIANLAAGTNEKTRAYFAHQAAQLGVTQVAGVTDDDLEADIARRGDKDAKAVKKERSDIAMAQAAMERDKRKAGEREHDEEVGIVRADEDFTVSTASMHGHRSQAQIQQRKKDHDEEMARRRQQLEETRQGNNERFAAEEERLHQRQEKLADSVNKLRQDQQSQREQAAFQAVSLQDRIQKVLIPTAAGLTTDTQRNEFVEASGGLVSRDDALFMLATPSGQAQMKRVMDAAHKAKASDTDEANAKFSETSVAKRIKAIADQQRVATGSVDSGEMFMANLKLEVEGADGKGGEWDRETKGGKLDDSLMSEAQEKAYLLRIALASKMSAFIAANPGTPEAAAAAKLMSDYGIPVGATMEQTIYARKRYPAGDVPTNTSIIDTAAGIGNDTNLAGTAFGDILHGMQQRQRYDASQPQPVSGAPLRPGAIGPVPGGEVGTAPSPRTGGVTGPSAPPPRPVVTGPPAHPHFVDPSVGSDAVGHPIWNPSGPVSYNNSRHTTNIIANQWTGNMDFDFGDLPGRLEQG